MNQLQWIIISFLTLIFTLVISFLIIWQIKPNWVIKNSQMDYTLVSIYSILISLITASIILIISLQNKLKIKRKQLLNLYKD